MSQPTIGKWYAELNQAATIKRTSVRLKWGDIVLKRGVAAVPPSSLLALRAGQDFTLEVKQRDTAPEMLSDLNAAVARHQALDLALTDAAAGGTASTRVSKIEALAIKQKVGESGPVIEIQLRKL